MTQYNAGGVGPGLEPSPVPSDRHLWPGELPFTAWGRHDYGELDLRVFDQDVWWVDIAQRPHRLVEMPAGYITNVIAFLAGNVEYFYYRTMRRALLQMWGDLLLGRIPSDVVAHALGAPALTDLTPSQWLEATPLMRALRRRAHRGRPQEAQGAPLRETGATPEGCRESADDA